MNHLQLDLGGPPASFDSATTKGSPGKSTLTSRLGATRILRVAEPAGPRDGNGVAADAEAVVERASSSSGAALPTHLQRQFEGSLGADLSGVRVHTGAASQDAAQAVGAKAYTVGQDIHFGAGTYQPDDPFGMHLLAHEVAHTVQQAGGAPHRQHKLEVSTPGDAAEHEADRAADAMVRGLAAEVSGGGRGVARIATAYSKDDDVKKLPPAPAFAAADGSFGLMATGVEASMKGDAAAVVPSPESGFKGSMLNLAAARDHAEGSRVYYDTHKPSAWNPFDSARQNPALAATAKADAEWATGMMGDVRVAGSATGSWVGLLNDGNRAWATLVKHARAMSIEVTNPEEKGILGDTKRGDQQIDKVELGGAGNELASLAKKAGLKAPDTSAYQRAMQDYNAARNELGPEQQTVITQLIPTNIGAIKEKKKAAEDEKEKWETIATAADTFEKGLTVAFSGAAFLEGEMGALGTKEVAGEATLDSPAGIDPADVVSKGHGVLAKGIELRLAAIQGQIAAYDANLKSYATVAEAMALKGSVGRLQNALVKLKLKAQNVEAEQARMQVAFREFGKTIDEALIKKGALPKGSKNASEAAGLLAALRTAQTTTDGAAQSLASGGTADLGVLYGGLATDASTRRADQTGGDGRRDGRSAVFGIEAGRWGAAHAAVTSIGGAIARRQQQIAALERSFLSQFSGASGGTDSIK